MVQKQKKLVGKMAGVKLAPLEYKKIQEFVDKGAFLNISDFIREAVREKIDETEVIELRDIDYETAKKEVLAYYEKFREAYPDEVGNTLGIDLETVIRITSELIKEKRLGVID